MSKQLFKLKSSNNSRFASPTGQGGRKRPLCIKQNVFKIDFNECKCFGIFEIHCFSRVLWRKRKKREKIFISSSNFFQKRSLIIKRSFFLRQSYKKR